MKTAIFTDTFHPAIDGVVSCIDSVARELMRQGRQGRLDVLFLSVWAARWLVDLALLWRFARRRTERKLLVLLPLLEVCYIPYVLLFMVIGGLGGFRWKQ